MADAAEVVEEIDILVYTDREWDEHSFVSEDVAEWRVFVADWEDEPVSVYMDDEVLLALNRGDENSWRALLAYVHLKAHEDS